MIHAAADWFTRCPTPGGGLATAAGRAPRPRWEMADPGAPTNGDASGHLTHIITSRTLSGSLVGQWGFTEERGAHWPLLASPARRSPHPLQHPTSHACSGAPGPALNPLLSSPVAAEHAPPRPIRSAAAECERRGRVTPGLLSVREQQVRPFPSNGNHGSRGRTRSAFWSSPVAAQGKTHSKFCLSIHVDTRLIKYARSAETYSPNKFKIRTIKHPIFVDTKGQL